MESWLVIECCLLGVDGESEAVLLRLIVGVIGKIMEVGDRGVAGVLVRFPTDV